MSLLVRVRVTVTVRGRGRDAQVSLHFHLHHTPSPTHTHTLTHTHPHTQGRGGGRQQGQGIELRPRSPGVNVCSAPRLVDSRSVRRFAFRQGHRLVSLSRALESLLLSREFDRRGRGGLRAGRVERALAIGIEST